MDPSDGCTILILAVLIYLSSYFSSAETALMSVSRLRLRSLADDGNIHARQALSMLEQQPKMLSAILIANNVVNLSASAIAGVLASRFGGNVGVAAATAVITLLILVFGEIAPKQAATLKAEEYALKCVTVIRTLMFILTPVIAVLGFLSGVVLKIRKIDPDAHEDRTTEEDIRTMVEVSHEDGVLKNDEKEMIYNVFDLSDSQAKDVMVPRVDVVSADVNSDYDSILKIFSGERFTRLPIYEETPDNIIGILNMKDMLLCDRNSTFSVRDLMREGYYTHEHKNCYDLFRDMRKKSVTMAIVLDEYGSMAGIITMEDMLEEIVGEIRDEYDSEELNEIRKIGPGEYIVEGSCSLDDLNDQIGTQLHSEEYDSIGGYLIGLLDHIPGRGEAAADADGNMLRAVEVDGKRIEKIRLSLAEKKQESHGTETAPEKAEN